MFLSPHKSPLSPLNRSRSSSYSSPKRNRIIYQEVYSIGSNTLVRSYSCDQVFDKDDSGRTFQTTQIQFSSFITPEKTFQVNQVETETKKPRRLAAGFSADRPEIKKNKTEIIKKDVLQTIIKRSMLFTFLTVTSACALYYYLSYKECGYVWNLERTENELKESIFGQDQSVTRITSVLEKCNTRNDVYIMVLTGGVGVGKTYTSSIISRNFPWSSNKLITYSEYFTADVEKLLNKELLTCGCNLVIVDDLSVKTAREAINLIMLLTKKRQNNENLLFILIFQAHTDFDRNEIVAEFENVHFNIYHIPFKPLSKDAIEKCYISEMKRQFTEIPKSELEILVEDKLKLIEIAKGPSGCKGVAEDVTSYYKRKSK